MITIYYQLAVSHSRARASPLSLINKNICSNHLLKYLDTLIQSYLHNVFSYLGTYFEFTKQSTFFVLAV